MAKGWLNVINSAILAIKCTDKYTSIVFTQQWKIVDIYETDRHTHTHTHMMLINVGAGGKSYMQSKKEQ